MGSGVPYRFFADEPFWASPVQTIRGAAKLECPSTSTPRSSRGRLQDQRPHAGKGFPVPFPRSRIRSSMRREAAFSVARFASAPGLAVAPGFGRDLDLVAEDLRSRPTTLFGFGTTVHSQLAMRN
jgi:hypothetical protein